MARWPVDAGYLRANLRLEPLDRRGGIRVVPHAQRRARFLQGRRRILGGGRARGRELAQRDARRLGRLQTRFERSSAALVAATARSASVRAAALPSAACFAAFCARSLASSGARQRQPIVALRHRLVRLLQRVVAAANDSGAYRSAPRPAPRRSRPGPVISFSGGSRARRGQHERADDRAQHDGRDEASPPKYSSGIGVTMKTVEPHDRPREKLAASRAAGARRQRARWRSCSATAAPRSSALDLANALLAAVGGCTDWSGRVTKSSRGDAWHRRRRAAQILAALELGRRTLTRRGARAGAVRAARAWPPSSCCRSTAIARSSSSACAARHEAPRASDDRAVDRHARRQRRPSA